MKTQQLLNERRLYALNIVIILFVWLLSFHIFASLAYQLFGHHFYNDANLRFLADAFLLRDVDELSSLRLFIVFPLLPIYLLTLLSYLPIIPPLFWPMWLSVVILSTWITVFLWRLWQLQAPGILLILLWAALITHPVMISTAIVGGNFIWSASASIITIQGLYSLSPRFHTVPLVHISLALTIIFLIDVNYFAVIGAMLTMVLVCLNHQRYRYDYFTLWATLIFPLLLIVAVVLIASLFQGHRMSGFIHGLPSLEDLTSLTSGEIIGRLKRMIQVIALGWIVFPIVIWNLIALRNHKTLFLVALMSSIFPGLVAFFAVDHLYDNHSFLIYYIGPVLVGIYHTFHYRRSCSYFSAVFILTMAGSLLLWITPTLESSIMEPLHVLSGQSTRQDFHEDIRLSTQLACLTPVMIDYRSGYPIIAAIGHAHDFVVPKTDLFNLAEEQKDFSSPLIFVPQPSHPAYAKDRVAKIYIDIYQKDNFKYHQVYKSKRWLILKKDE